MPFNLRFEHTPDSSKPMLCDSCRWANIARGSNGERDIRCSERPRGSMGEGAAVQMRVTECSSYTAHNRQTLYEMEKTAWLLGTKKIVGLAGGRSGEDTQITWSKPEDRASKFDGPETTSK